LSVQLVSKISNLCDHNPPTLQTDGRTDGRHAIPRPRICTKVHCAVKIVKGIRADGPDVVWVEHDSDSTVSYVRGIRGEPRDFLRTRDVLTWSVRSPAWHWSAVDVDYANKKIFLADKADRFVSAYRTYIKHLSGFYFLFLCVFFFGSKFDIFSFVVFYKGFTFLWCNSIANIYIGIGLLMANVR